jgi:hypothetical protein
MLSFHTKREQPWKLSLIVLSVFIILFTLGAYKPGVMPEISAGALYMLFAVYLLALILMLFIDKWNSKGILVIDENGVSYKSAFPSFLRGLSYVKANTFRWEAVSEVRLTYDTQFSRTQDWALLVKKFKLKQNIVVSSGGNSIFLHAKFFSADDYEKIVGLLEQYAGNKIKNEKLPSWA